MNPPSQIKLHKQDQTLELAFSDGLSDGNTDSHYLLSSEFLRVYSPSAEVRGHGNPVLQMGKKFVNITAVEAIGNYAIKLTFDDGHDTGIYSWDYLLDLCQHQPRYWQQYLDELSAGKASRDPNESVIKLFDPSQH